MIYALILTVFLGNATNMFPVITEIEFSTEAECVKAARTASFQTKIPVIKANAVCEKRPQT